jgi:NitT/TauT family transport system substrate-binding protein
MRLTWAGVRVSNLRIAPVVVAVAMLASGCQVFGSGASGAGPGGGQITVAVVPGIDNAPLRVGVEDGLFKQHGLNVTVKDYQSPSAEFHALASGQAQIAEGDYTGFLYEQATGGASLTLIADAYDAAANSVAILATPQSKITSPLDLQTRSVDVATPPAGLSPHSTDNPAVPYNIETLAAQEVLQNDGVSPSGVTWTPQPGPSMLPDLHSGQVQAILVTEPYILQAEEQFGAVEVVDASTGVTSGLPLAGYFSLHSYAHANPSAVRAFQTALDQAQADCAQRGPVQAVLPQLTGMSSGDAAQITLGTYPTTLNLGQVQRVATLMFDSGMISNQVSVTALTSG